MDNSCNFSYQCWLIIYMSLRQIRHAFQTPSFLTEFTVYDWGVYVCVCVYVKETNALYFIKGFENVLSI